jgi:hypothetical protein
MEGRRQHSGGTDAGEAQAMGTQVRDTRTARDIETTRDRERWKYGETDTEIPGQRDMIDPRKLRDKETEG